MKKKTEEVVQAMKTKNTTDKGEDKKSNTTSPAAKKQSNKKHETMTDLKRVKEVLNSDAVSSSGDDNDNDSSSSSSLDIEDSTLSVNKGLKKQRASGSGVHATMNRADAKRASISQAPSGSNGPKSQERVLTPRSKRLAAMYEEIKYEDDETILPWQRQLKVNRFMADLEIKKTIDEQLKPVQLIQLKIQHMIKHKFSKVFDKLDKRLKLIEQDVFGEDGPEHRFEVIEKDLLQLKVDQKQQQEEFTGMNEMLEQKLNNKEFEIHGRLQKVEVFETEIQTLYAKHSQLQDHLHASLEKLNKEQADFTNKMTINLDKVNTKLMNTQNEMTKIDDRLIEAENGIWRNKDSNIELGKNLFDLKFQIDPLQEKKLDMDRFSEYTNEQHQRFEKLTDKVNNMVSDVDTTGNYLQKYVPMQIQRTLTHVLGFVFPQKDVAWRLNWYNELRMPMLSATLLNDEGQMNLSRNLERLKEFVHKNPVSIMELGGDDSFFTNKDELMQDEKLMSNVLGSMKLHSKAKLIIFQRLDQLEKARLEKGISTKDDQRDMYEQEMDFKDIQEVVFKLIVEEDPQEAKKLGILSGQVDSQENFGVGMIDEDEEAGLESQVQAIVENFTKQHEEQVNKRLVEIEEQLNSQIVRDSAKLLDYQQQQNSHMESQINMVHLQHIQDFQESKNITREFVESTERLDQKIQIVVHLEKAYQQLLGHMKNTSQVVDQLIQLNLNTADAKDIDQELSSPSIIRQTFNFNPVASAKESYDMERVDTQLGLGDAHQMVNAGNESSDQDGLSDYNHILGNFNKGIKNNNVNNHGAVQHTRGGRDQQDQEKASDGAESSSQHSNQSQGADIMNLKNYYNIVGTGAKIYQSQLTTKQSVKSVKNQAFIQKRTGTSKIKHQYHIGKTQTNFISPSNQDTEMMLAGGNPDQLGILTPQAVSGDNTTGSGRPKSQAAGAYARAKRNSNLAGNSAMSILRHPSGQSIGAFDFTALVQPSEASALERTHGISGQMSNARTRLQTQQSCRTTQNKNKNLARGNMCGKHTGSGIEIKTPLNARSSLNMRTVKNNHASNGQRRQIMIDESSSMQNFDRGKALKKLLQLGSEARKLVTKLDSMIMPGEEEAQLGQTAINKKIQQHRKGLKMLPDAHQFKSELVQFQKRLDSPSKAQKLIEKSGGMLNKLNFPNPGVNMKFGISHRGGPTSELSLDRAPGTQKASANKTAAEMRKYTPNALASKQEFEQVDCGLDQPYRASAAEIRATDSSTEQTEVNSQQRGHIFCKKEVINSVNRVL